MLCILTGGEKGELYEGLRVAAAGTPSSQRWRLSPLLRPPPALVRAVERRLAGLCAHAPAGGRRPRPSFLDFGSVSAVLRVLRS